MRGRTRTGEDRICKACGKEYYVSGWRLKRGSSRFCGTECQNHKQYERPTFVCKHCNKTFTSAPSRRNKKIYCSLQCSYVAQIEQNADIRKKRREAIAELRASGLKGNSGPALRKWVLEEKENKCMICSYKEQTCCLDIHHIDNNPSNNDIGNLAILCVMCHRKVHRKLINLKKRG